MGSFRDKETTAFRAIERTQITEKSQQFRRLTEPTIWVETNGFAEWKT